MNADCPFGVYGVRLTSKEVRFDVPTYRLRLLFAFYLVPVVNLKKALCPFMLYAGRAWIVCEGRGLFIFDKRPCSLPWTLFRLGIRMDT